VKTKKIKTSHIELLIAAVVVLIPLYGSGFERINVLTALAVFFSFQHTQISERLSERRRLFDSPSVAGYKRLSLVFFIKEAFWISAFVWMGNWVALCGSVLFFLYPVWRFSYRRRKPTTQLHPSYFVNQKLLTEKCTWQMRYHELESRYISLQNKMNITKKVYAKTGPRNVENT
jgi:hypothetical protein